MAIILGFFHVLDIFDHPLSKQSQQNISIDTSLVGLIDDVNIESITDHHLPNSHAVSHEADLCFLRSLLFKPNIISNLFSNSIAHLLGYSLGEAYCTDSSGLGD